MKKVRIKSGKSNIALPAAAIERLPDATDLDLRVLLTLLARGDSEAPEIAEEIGADGDDVAASLAFWRGAGVVEYTTGAKRPAVEKSEPEAETPKEKPQVKKKLVRPADSMPEYTSEEISGIVKKRKKLANLIDAAQQTFGKMFTPAEINTIIGMQDYLGLDEAYILILLAHCRDIDKKSVKYAEKTAFSLVDDGIDTPAALEAHFIALDGAKSSEGKWRGMFGMGKRALTAKEKKIFFVWSEKGYPADVIEYAYERTIARIKEPSVEYTNGILERWHAEGLLTLDAVKVAEEEGKGKKDKGGKDKKSSFEADDFFELALKRSYGDKK